MAFSGGTFSRTFDCTTDRDNGVKILASKFDTELDGMATGLSTTILKDGTQTCTAAIPFAQGITIADNKTITLGTNSDITIQYDETTNDSLEIAANVEGAALGIVLKADQGDDAGDEWKLNIADGGTLTLGNDINSAGTYVTHLTITPNATVASSTTAVAGNLTIGGALTLGSGAVISEAELETIDGITPGTAAASKAMVLDASLDISGGRNLTISGELDAATLDISGDVDVDGTLEADAITVGGTALATVIAGTTVTNATNSAHVLVTDNESTNEENLIAFVEGATSSTGNVGLEMDGNFAYNPSTGTVSATIFKGNIDAVDGDFDGTLEADAITIGGTAIASVLSPVAGSGSIVTTGALNSGSITSGFGAIDNGSSAITTTGVGSFGSLDISGNADIDGTLEADAITIGSTSINSIFQPLDAQLTDVAGLAVTDSGFIVGDGSNFVLETGATVRTSLGLGTAAVLDTGIANTNIPKFTTGVADDDFLRVAGTSIEGRSAAEVLSDIGASAVAGSGSIVTTGALNAGSITSGFGAIDNGASAITTTGTATAGLLNVDNLRLDANTISNVSDNPLIFGANNTERVRVTSAGDVGIGRSDPQNIVGDSGGGLVVRSAASRAATTTAIAFQDSSGNNMFSQLHNGQTIFSTGAVGSKTEAMRITSAGEINVAGKSSNANNIGNTYFHIQNANRGHDLRFAKSESGSFDALVFYHSGSAVGYISYGNTSTSYNTSSDYRLKENVTDITGATDRLKQLNPVRFNFIADAVTTVDGFLAHEVATVIPEAISGEKDAVDDDGNAVYQGIDQSKLVPLLTAALQEALTKIDQLETRITALEA